MSPVLKISQDSAEIFKFLLKFNQNCPLWAHSSHFGGKIGHCVSFWAALCEVIWKSWKTPKIANVPPQEQKFLRFLQKWDTLVVKRWEKLWMRWNWPFQVNLSLILRKRWKNLQNDQNWPFGANPSHFFDKICHCGSFWATSVWNDLKKLKNSKKLPVHINRDSAEIFKFPSVLIIAQHSLDSFWPVWKNEPCSEGLVQIGHDSAEILGYLSVLIIA